jgi:hypothetical protein
MPGVVSHPILGPHSWKTARVGESTARIGGARAGGGSLLLGAVIALAAIGVPAETIAQGNKSTAPGSGPDAKAKAGATPEDIYGDQGGEKVAPANARLANSVMRARREDTFYKISNPRVGQTSGRGPKRNALLVDYEVVSRGKFDGGTLVLRSPEGRKSEVALTSIKDRDEGTIELVGVKFFGNIAIAKNTTFPKNIEMYVIRSDERYDPPAKWMVSNSVVMGKMKTTTRARDWTRAEIERYTRPPPSYKNPNAYPEIGEDVPPLTAAGGDFRFVDPKGRLLGLDYAVGMWEKQKTVSQLTPVYSADQPRLHSARSIARKGYAVAGAEVNADKYVNGIRLLFRRVKPDGTLDEKDTYAGEWIGVAPAGKATTLVNDGRRVLGIRIQRGAIIDRFALVVEAQEK